MRIAVAGGTGVIGRHVVTELAGRGHEAVVIARSRGIDLTTGAGLDAALDGCGAVVDVASVVTISRRKAVGFFEPATTHLLAAARRTGVGHVLPLSIVGVPTVDYGYYLGKRRQEELVAAGPVPWTLLRATQFHEFAGQVADRTRVGPFVAVPDMLSQPVAAREVAARLVELVESGPQGVVEPMAGPEPIPMTEMVRRYLAATGRPRRLVRVRLPGAVGRQLASGAMIPEEPFLRGTQTYADYLATLKAGR